MDQSYSIVGDCIHLVKNDREIMPTQRGGTAIMELNNNKSCYFVIPEQIRNKNNQIFLSFSVKIII